MVPGPSPLPQQPQLHFSEERWSRILETNRLWREHKLGRPLVQWTLGGYPTDIPEPSTPPNGKGTTSFERSFSVEQIVDRWAYDLSRRRFLGDAFPCFWIDFGPGIVAEFVGGSAVPKDGTVWFYPGKFQGMDIQDIHLEYSESSPWLERIIEIGRAAIRRFDGMVQVGMTDLGGALDIVASLRGTENLLYDCVDAPEEVERLVWEVHALWHRYYDLIAESLRGNHGYTSWPDVFGERPNYMLQCDFSYMIGPEMFNRFVAPELRATCQRLDGGCFYHQDGVGELPHTATLHAIPELAGIQWQPGDGDHPPSILWFDQQRRIRDDGKLSQTWGSPEELEALVNAIGDVSNCVVVGWGRPEDEPRFRAALSRLGIDAE